MIEIHLIRLEPAVAIHTRDSAKLAEQFDGASLTNSDAADFEVAVAPVVRDVCWALIAAR